MIYYLGNTRGVEYTMTNYEKGLLLKDSIYQLYVNEGRSISYLSRLFNIDRHTLSVLIKQTFGFVQGNQDKRKIREFLSQYKEYIIARIKDGWTQREIYTHCDVGQMFYKKVITFDVDIQNAMLYRTYKGKEQAEYILDEVWKPIYGYDNYQISNYGRIRNKYGMIKTQINCKSGYVTVTLSKDGKRQGHRVHRLVARAFCSGYSSTNNCVNHIDGNILNNRADNLEWCSYSDNLIHSYKYLGRPHKGGGSLSYRIKYKDKYIFKTIAAFARFVGISPTQARRWIDEEKPEIKKIPK